MWDELARNKQTAMDFYDLMFNQRRPGAQMAPQALARMRGLLSTTGGRLVVRGR